MKVKSNLKLRASVVLTAVALGLSGTVIAAPVVSGDFETGAYSYGTNAAGTATLSIEQANSPTHAVKFVLPDTQNDFARVAIDVVPGTVTLSQAVGTFMMYIPGQQTAGPDAAPYMYYLVDTNSNGTADIGTGDSFVIAFFTPTITPGTWVQSGLDQSDNVHVVLNRTGLLGNEFSSSNGGGLLSDLYTRTLGTGSWGDLDILQVRVGVGNTGSNVGPYTAYVDDINVNVNASAVPEPGTLALVGLALAGLGYGRRKQA